MNNENAFTFRYGKYKGRPVTSAGEGYLRWLALNSRPKSFSMIHIVATDELVRRREGKGSFNTIDAIDEEMIEIIAENASDANIRLLVLPRYLKIQEARESARKEKAAAIEAYRIADASLGDSKAVTWGFEPTESAYDSYTTYEGFYADVKNVVEKNIRGSRNDDPQSSRPQNSVVVYQATGEGRIKVTVHSSCYAGH